jgi:hypothetical protein
MHSFRKIVGILLLFLLLPGVACAEAIGADTVFSFAPIEFLTPSVDNPENAAVFNYFFTIEIFCGMVGLFVRLLLRTFRL